MNSTVGQLRDFSESVIWTDMKNEMDIWLSQIHEQLENHGMECSHRDLDRLGGCAEAIRNFHDIIHIMIDLADDDISSRSTTLKNLTKGR